MQEKIEKIKLNNLSWKLSLKNYSATGIGGVLYFCCLLITFNFWTNNQPNFGVLSPVVLIFLIQLMIKMLFLVPRPITTYEVIEEYPKGNERG